MTPTFFPTPADFRTWLAANHDKETELLVGFYKVGSGRPSMTWSQSVDEALCFGWIDGVRKSIDGDSYCIRFTPRKPKSIWSAVNIAKIEELTTQGQMHPAGVAAFAKREENKSKIYAYEQKDVSLSDEFETLFKANENAWIFFQKQAPWYKKQMINWVMSAKQLATQVSRLDKLIRESTEGRKL
ncbi:bacteriocin-protection protein [Spirosoma sp. HMF4905]|uniref:Bacteriocin-protection protein n=1 Tax=Spirosoma arboris TaxID=2682092 RepID=A0A7K1SCV4_9BACT|nr:YdeI/OmpD-associated family protein [Spirosoma arboris]MVM31647.1 bacteriocin-protection protein [Spirosoma arboris]